MGKLVCTFFFVLVLLALMFSMIILESPKNRPTLEPADAPKADPNAGTPQSYIVKVWITGRYGRGFFYKYRFAQNKKGRYRLRYSAWDWIVRALEICAELALYIKLFIDDWENALEDPLIEIPYYIGLLLIMIFFYLVLNNSEIRARRFFKATFSDLK